MFTQTPLIVMLSYLKLNEDGFTLRLSGFIDINAFISDLVHVPNSGPTGFFLLWLTVFEVFVINPHLCLIAVIYLGIHFL